MKHQNLACKKHKKHFRTN